MSAGTAVRSAAEQLGPLASGGAVRPVGHLTWISGPVMRARLARPLALLEQVWAGEAHLVGEVIAVEHDSATLQIYEETAGLRPGEPLYAADQPFTALLGPGLLGQIYDGIQRPLALIRAASGIRVERGLQPAALPERSWTWTPRLRPGDELRGGECLGTVPETPLLEHRVLAPPDAHGWLEWVAPPGEVAVTAPIGVMVSEEGARRELGLWQRWPVRRERPIRERLDPERPLVSGQRVLDTFFPLAKGGSAALPGPFGAGKTILEQALAKWSDAQVVIYVGCGERGNEMAQVLEEFATLTDPRGRPLLERTILIANTSNMPVAAREASIYTGITLAEYYRDQGYDVALLADSTSRWAEALREISGRLEEMPAEEGFPAYLPSRLGAFYERAGRVRTLAGDEGSVSLIATVSPPGGDFTEPVTKHTQRFCRAFWALDRSLASARHYPAISWQTSYSAYGETVSRWWQAIAPDWPDLRRQAMELLENDARLEQLVRLVGAEALPDRQRWLLLSARLIKEGFLQQNALHPVDAHCPPAKQAGLLRLYLRLHARGQELIEAGLPLLRLRERLDQAALVRLKETLGEDPTEIERTTQDLLARLEGA